MTQKTLKGLTRDLRKIPKKTEVGMVYSFSGGKSISGEETFNNWLTEIEAKNLSPEKKTEVAGMFGNLRDFDFAQGYQILRGYNSTIVKILEIQGKTIVKEERPNRDFNNGEIVVMDKSADRYGITRSKSFGKVLKVMGNYVNISYYYLSTSPNSSRHDFGGIRTKDICPQVYLVKESEVKKTNFMLKVCRDWSIKVYPTERGLYGEKISLEEALKKERLRDGVEGFLDVWRKDFDKFEIKPYEGGK